jgi:uncharacterized membrane protein YfcA
MVYSSSTQVGALSSRAGGWQIGAGATAQTDTQTQDVAWYFILLLGLGAGVISGMFGVGGGIVIVPALVTFLRFDQKLAVGTSLGALLLPVGVGTVYSY